MDDWLLNWLHHHHRFGLLNYYDRLLMDHGHWGYHKETTISFRPISEVEVVNVEYVLKWTSSYVVHQPEMVSFLHDTWAKEHIVTSSMTQELLLPSLVRSELNPLSHLVHPSH
jgi:hypothetical protein